MSLRPLACALLSAGAVAACPADDPLNGRVSGLVGEPQLDVYEGCAWEDCDDDGDGLPNGVEQAIATDPYNPDTDGDGRPDGVEVVDPAAPADADGDGKHDALESALLDPDADCLPAQWDPNESTPIAQSIAKWCPTPECEPEASGFACELREDDPLVTCAYHDFPPDGCCASDADCAHLNEPPSCNSVGPEGCTGYRTQAVCQPDGTCLVNKLASGEGCAGEVCAVAECVDGGALWQGGGVCDDKGTCLAADEICDDVNSCTVDDCASAEGCRHEPLPNGTICGPASKCWDGVCVPCDGVEMIHLGTWVGSGFGQHVDIEVVGDYLVSAAGAGGVQVFDLSVGGGFQTLSITQLPADAQQVELEWPWAWVGTPQGVYRLDLSDPSEPVVVDSVDLPAEGLLVRDGLVVVTSFFDLRLLDASLNELDVAPFVNAEAVEVADGILYAVTDGGFALSLYAISGGSLAPIGTAQLPGKTSALHKVPGGPLYMAAGTAVYEASWSGDELGFVEIAVGVPYNSTSFWVEGGYMAAGNNSTLTLFAQGADGTWQQVVEPNALAPAVDVVLAKGRLWAARATAGLAAWNLETFEVDFELSVGAAQSVRVVGQIAYVADGGAGLRTLDLSDLVNPVELSTVPTPGDALELAVEGDILYVASGTSGLVIFDASAPEIPELIAIVPLPGISRDVEVRDGLAAVAAGEDGLHLIDVTNPYQPELRASVQALGKITSVWINPGVVYAVDDAPTGGMRMFDVDDPGNPVWFGTVVDLFEVRDIAVVGGLALISGIPYGFRIFDISAPDDPKSLSKKKYSWNPQALYVVHNIAYVAAATFGIVAIDVSSPEEPQAIQVLKLPGYSQGIHGVGNYAYIAAADGGVHIAELVCPTADGGGAP